MSELEKKLIIPETGLMQQVLVTVVHRLPYAAVNFYALDLVRTRLVAQRNAMYYQGIGHAFRTICREEGFFGLYKGLGATMLGVAPSLAINFDVYEKMKYLWQFHRPNDSK